MSIKNDLVLRTLRGEKTERTPVWFMRQAGRYLPDYIALREKHSFFERVRNPDLAAAITVMPVDQMDVDAAILFSDILVIAQALGVDVEILEGRGPVIAAPVRSAAHVQRLDPSATEEKLAYAIPATQAVRQALHSRVPLIGFCGSPWTLLCYMVEGKGSKDFAAAKRFCYEEPEAALALLEKITDASIRYLNMQIAAGADVIQIFDSWGGLLGPSAYSTFSLPFMQKITTAVAGRVPVILFAKGAWFALRQLQQTGAAALGLDWTTSPAFAKAAAPGIVLQGNLDPAVLLGPAQVVKSETEAMLRAFGPGGHIANLGHGILPQTSAANARIFVDTVKTFQHERA